MKNVLFATTALVSVAGVAFADAHEGAGVALSGSAEMGVTYFDDGTNDRAVFHNDIDVTFTLSGSTPNGLTFGATIDLDEVGDGDNLDFENSVFISGSWGTLSMGDVDGAYDKALTEIAAGGLSDEADQASGTAGIDPLAPEILRYDYSFGPVTLSASLGLEDQQPTNDEAGGTSSAALDDNVYGVGVAYAGAFGSFDLGAGIGAQFSEATTGDDIIVFGGSLVVGYGGFELIGVVESFDNDGGAGAAEHSTGEVFGVSAQYTTGPFSIAFGYQLADQDARETDTFQTFGTYDLGGGAELVASASYVDGTEFGADVEETRAGFGLGFSF